METESIFGGRKLHTEMTCAVASAIAADAMHQ